MFSGIKIYRIKDFIRKTESGEIDFDKSIQIVRELSAAAAFHADHHILIDLRKTKVSFSGVNEVIKVVLEFVLCMPSFKNKIANVVPSSADRVSMAKKFEACMQIKNFQYRFFTEFEQAIEWLSDVTT